MSLDTFILFFRCQLLLICRVFHWPWTWVVKWSVTRRYFAKTRYDWAVCMTNTTVKGKFINTYWGSNQHVINVHVYDWKGEGVGYPEYWTSRKFVIKWSYSWGVFIWTLCGTTFSYKFAISSWYFDLEKKLKMKFSNWIFRLKKPTFSILKKFQRF